MDLRRKKAAIAKKTPTKVEKYREANKIKKGEKCNAFISGPTDITKKEFDEHYLPEINQAMDLGDNFILTDSPGADQLALQHLVSRKIDPDRVLLYIRNFDNEEDGVAMRVDAFRTSELFGRYIGLGLYPQMLSGVPEARDSKLTGLSDYDILWVRPNASGKSRVDRNVERREEKAKEEKKA